MKTIETTIEVDESRRVSFQLPLDVLPGLHQMLVVVDDKIGTNNVHLPDTSDLEKRIAAYRPPAVGESCMGPLGITVFNSGPMLIDAKFNRDEIYDDEVL